MILGSAVEPVFIMGFVPIGEILDVVIELVDFIDSVLLVLVLVALVVSVPHF